MRLLFAGRREYGRVGRVGQRLDASDTHVNEHDEQSGTEQQFSPFRGLFSPHDPYIFLQITTPKLMGIASRGAEDTYSHRKKTPARAYNPYAELMNQSRAASNHLRTPLHRSPFSNGPGLSKIQSNRILWHITVFVPGFTPHISRSNGTSQRPFSPNSIMRLGSAGFTPNMIRQTGNIIPKSNTPSFARPF